MTAHDPEAQAAAEAVVRTYREALQSGAVKFTRSRPDADQIAIIESVGPVSHLMDAGAERLLSSDDPEERLAFKTLVARHAGLGIAEIGRRFGISRQHVYRLEEITTEAGFNPPPKRREE